MVVTDITHLPTHPPSQDHPVGGHTAEPTGRGEGLAKVFPPLVVLVGFMALWYAISYLMLDPSKRFLMPPPHEVISVGFLDGANFAELMEALWLSTRVAMAGLVIAIVIGMGLAIAMSQERWIERSVFPYAVIVQTIPILALVPLLGFWFGFDFRSRVLVCVLISIFPIVTNTLFGLLSAERGQHDLFSLQDASRLTRLFKLQLPAAMPAIFAGFRISAGLSVVGAIVGDFFFRQGKPGIGILIDIYRARIQSPQLFAAIIVSSLLGVFVFWAFTYLHHRVVGPWDDSRAPH